MLASYLDADGVDLFTVDFNGIVVHQDRTTGLTEVFSAESDFSDLHATVGTGPALGSVSGIAVAPGGSIYIADGGDDVVYEVDRDTGDRVLLSGGGAGSGPALQGPSSIAWDPFVGRIVVGDNGSPDAIVTIDPGTGARVRLSEAGTPGPAFSNPAALGVDPTTGTIYVADPNSNPQPSVFAVDGTTGERTTVSGNGIGAGPALDNPRVLEFTDDGDLYIGNRGTSAILSVDLTSGDRTLVASTDVGDGPDLIDPFDLTSADGELLVSDSNARAIFAVDPATGDRVTEFTSTLGIGQRIANNPEDIVTDGSHLYVLITSGGFVLDLDPQTGDRTVVGDVGGGIFGDSGMRYAAGPDRFYIVNRTADALVVLDAATGVRTVLSDDDDGGASVGGGPAFSSPADLALDLDNAQAFVVDSGHSAVLAVDLTTGTRSVISDLVDDTAGGGMVGSGPGFQFPESVVFDADDQRLYVGDSGTDAIISVSLVAATLGNRTIVSSDAVDPMVGDGPTINPNALFLDSAEARLLATDRTTNAGAIHAIDLATGDRTVVSGSYAGIGEGWATSSPRGITRLGDDLFFSDGQAFVSSVDTEGNRWVIASGATSDPL